VKNPQNILEEAEDLKEKGNYKAALKKLIWVLHCSLIHDPAFYGVRLSFALSTWVDLAEDYPEAFEVLRRIRDRKESHLRKKDQNLNIFHDVLAINKCLDESNRTIDIIKYFDNNFPSFTNEITTELRATHILLLETREFEIFKKYKGSVIKVFEESLQDHREAMQIANNDKSTSDIINKSVVQTAIKYADIALAMSDKSSLQHILKEAILFIPDPNLVKLQIKHNKN